MISGPNWSATLQGLLAGKGFVGTRLSDFTDAVGNGGQTHVVGKAFTTTDAGLVPGAGPSPGVGVGVTGISGPAISTLIFALATGFFGQSGSKLMDTTDAIGDACVAELALADLNSTHAPVFSGSGVVDVGSIGVIPAGWGSDIDAAAPSFIGSQWSNFANAMGMGQANHVLAAGTGNVVISGSFGGSSPPGPLPGAGVGAGVVS